MPKNSRQIVFSLLDTPAFGGAEQYLTQGLMYLAKHDYRVVLATNNAVVKKEIVARLKAANIRQKNFAIIDAPYLLDAIGNWKGLVKFFLACPQAWWWCARTLRNLQQKGPVICLWPGFSDRLVLSPLAKWMGCRLLWIEIGPLEPTFQKNWGFPKLLYRLTQHYPDHFITTSRFTLKSMTATGKVPAGQVRLVYPGAELWTAQQRALFKRQGLKLLKQLGLDQKKIVTYLGRLAAENEVELVVQAFAKVCRRQKHLQLLLIGDGPQKVSLQKLVKDLGISQKVFFTGFVPEQQKYSLLAASQIFIFPRAWELDGFGMTTIEAMSAGIPVITSDFGPQQEIIQNGVNGLRFTPHDYLDLARALEYLVAHPTQQKQFAMAGLSAVKKFSVQEMQHRLKNVIDQYSL